MKHCLNIALLGIGKHCIVKKSENRPPHADMCSERSSQNLAGETRPDGVPVLRYCRVNVALMSRECRVNVAWMTFFALTRLSNSPRQVTSVVNSNFWYTNQILRQAEFQICVTLPHRWASETCRNRNTFIPTFSGHWSPDPSPRSGSWEPDYYGWCLEISMT